MKTKVAIVTAANPYRDIRAIKFATSLQKMGFDPIIIGGFSKETDFFDAGFSIFNYDIKYNDKSGRVSKIIYKSHFYKYVRNVLKRENPAIIQACNVDMLFCVRKLTKHGVKTIYDSYEICAHKTGFASNKIIGKIIERIENKLLKKVDWMICVSHSAREYFLKKYSVKNITTITNSPIVKKPVIERIKNQPLRALYIGGYANGRGIEEYIESGKYINPQKCKLTLRAFGNDEKRFKDISSNNCLEQVVEFLPIVNPTEIIDVISKTADIGIVLTKNTCLNHKLTVSNKIFDYVNAGIPVIMSNVDEHILINNEYKIGIVLDEITPQTVAESINSLVDNDELYNELSNNCLKAAKILNWNAQEKTIKTIYDEVLIHGLE